MKHTLRSMEQLGLEATAAQKCARKMHIAAIKQLHSIVMTRRHLEHGGTTQHTHTPTEDKISGIGHQRHQHTDSPRGPSDTETTAPLTHPRPTHALA